MFEKDEDEIAKDIYIHHFDDDINYPDVLEAITVGVQKGAEFGYNKANEWHNLLKNPDDLPKEGEIVLCYCLGYCGASYPITARMYVDYTDSSIHHWLTLGGEGKSEELSDVLAWKEIVLPELKESE